MSPGAGPGTRWEDGDIPMRSLRSKLQAALAAGLLLAVLAAFAVELSATQSRSRHDVELQVHQRSQLAGALLDSLFGAAATGNLTPSSPYAAATVDDATLDAHVATDTYLALLGPDGTVLASSSRFTPEARSHLGTSSALALVRSGRPYGLGNVSSYGTTGVLDFAVAIPTPYGRRVLLTGFSPSVLSAFVTNELRAIPGVKGSTDYMVDGNGVVLASTDKAATIGQVIPDAGIVAVLGHEWVDVGGSHVDQVQLTNATWHVVLAAPASELFADESGLHRWVPWLILAAFALAAVVAGLLGRRVIKANAETQAANVRLAGLNEDLLGANAALERRAAELARSNEELDKFASIASHDLQEPLRKVRTFTAQLVAMEGDHLSEKGLDYINRANAAAERMQTLISDLLTFSRISTQGRPFTPVDLSALAAEVVDDLEVQITNAGAHVRVGHLPTIDADELQMRQLLQNLLSNSIKFRREGVVPEITITARVVDGTAELVVVDNGTGFEPQYSARIFRVFERLQSRKEFPGTGIGLALCRKIADRHGGTIVAEGRPGEGATFTVSLPLRQPAGTGDAPPDEPAPVPALAASTGSARG